MGQPEEVPPPIPGEKLPSQWLSFARELGISLIDAGHFATENPVCTYLQEQIAAAFPEIAVKVSESNRDCMKFF